jgi:hypothetical protein
MKKCLFLTAGIILFFGYGCQNHGVPANPNATSFGAAFTETAGIPASTAVMAADSVGTKVIIAGKVANVCQAEGCWFNLNLDSNRLLFVDFDHKFTVPKNLGGKDVLVLGTFYHDTISVEQQKHLAEDAGKPKSEIDLITMPKIELNFRAQGVKINAASKP